MRDGIDVDTERHNSVADRLNPDDFIDAQYRKTELRKRYRDSDAAERIGKLIRTIEFDVIPQLVIARRASIDSCQASLAPAGGTASGVVRLARLLLGHETDLEPSRFVANVRTGGVSVEDIFLNLLAPAARHVGTMWDNDLCTFVDVTLALGTLHRIMSMLSVDFPVESRKIDWARRVLLVQYSGTEHTFGLTMVAEFFRRGAWSVDMAASSTNVALAEAVQADWYTVIGFSAACHLDIDALAETIRTVREVSLNSSVGILVGGPAFASPLDQVARIGADGMASDAIHAVLEAERFVLRTA
jgi:methanogenic corrinoid protein MtbC1